MIDEKQTFPNWGDFASRVSGEWDGYGAEFSNKGDPIELPEVVVPQAFREWEVKVFDWQTQCPTLAQTKTPTQPTLMYKLIKLLPTVGCEADAATRHSVEERTIGEFHDNTNASVSMFAFAYDQQGSYVAIWASLKDKNGEYSLELEHCLIDPRDQENRMRIVQVVGFDGTTMELQKIYVYSENWYGPFRNGEQLGGCAIHQSAFASTLALSMSDVLGAWEGVTSKTADFHNSENACMAAMPMCELVKDQPQKVIRDKEGLVTLPKQVWSSLKNKREDSEVLGEVGWMLDHGRAMTSTCVFSKEGNLKKIAIGLEAATLEE